MLWIFLFPCFVFSQVYSKLILVEVIFRHGDRAPTILYPTDPNPEGIWKEGLGKLTLLGRKQQYAVGKLLRSMYQDFVTSNPNEVIVNSKYSDRCLRSAECNIAGFYAPSAEWTFDQNIPWQPVPIRYMRKTKDMYLNHESNCPEAFKETKRISSSPSCQQLLKDHEKMLKILSYHSGMNLNDTSVTDDFYDTLFVEKKYNLIIPRWVDTYWDELSEFAQKSLLCRFPTPLLQRLRAGPFLGKLIKDLKKKISGKLSDLKVRVHSAHDHNIKTVLAALNVFNNRQPPYCATVIFELHQENTFRNAVRLLYLNSTTPEDGFQVPHVLVLPGCSEYCPLDYFITYTQDLIPDDWHYECGLTKKEKRRQESKLEAIRKKHGMGKKSG